MIVIDNERKIDIELTELELTILEDSLKQTPYGLTEFYGKTFINLLNKLEKARGVKIKTENGRKENRRKPRRRRIAR